MSELDLDLPLDVNAIKRLIPHRYPILLVDKVTSIDVEAKTAVGVKAVSGSEAFFQGHFPEQPVMPGVLTIEALAQTSAIYVTKAVPEAAGKLVYFMSIDNAKFRAPVVPGDLLHLEVSLLQQRRRVFRFHGEAKVDGKVMAEADFAAMITDPPEQ